MRLHTTRDGRVTPLTWVFAPEWLTFEEACVLSGMSREEMQEILDDDGVELNDEGLIGRDSLREFREALLLVLQMRDQQGYDSD